MSGNPHKRLHEDGGSSHSCTPKYTNGDSGAYPFGSKLIGMATNEYHSHPDVAQDARMPTITRTESHDADRRSPLIRMYRMLSSSNDSHSDNPLTLESRMELRDSIDSNRNIETEKRELYQSMKGDKDMRFDSRGGGNKEMKFERDTYSECKVDVKSNKDSYSAIHSDLNWKDSKKQHRGKRYMNTSGVDSWSASRSNIHGPSEVGKEVLTSDQKEYVESHEAFVENKSDLKGEDKFKEKDRKRKDGRHGEFGERDKELGDCWNNLQFTRGNNECKESAGEDKEAERWDWERKDLSKDVDKLKDKDKDHINRETMSGAGKESVHSEKEVLDVSGRAVELENLSLEQKKQKDNDSWKNLDTEAREMKKEREGDTEGERSEKRRRFHEKESNDGCVDSEGGTDRERENFNHGVQQRKRMLRPRGSPQLVNRDARSRSRVQDNEGSQGKPGVSFIIYRVGECMQELIKLWKEHESSPADKSCESSQTGPTLEIRVSGEHVNSTNRQVRGGQLWGTDVYTDDSDLVAVLMHTGYCRLNTSAPPSHILELRATIKVLPPRDCYISSLRNNVRSRAWGAAIGCSYCVERCCIVKKEGGTIDLEPCLMHMSTVEPTLAPVAVERTMTTRAAASNALRNQRFVREVTIQYNLCNEPWQKYSISVVADKGVKKTLYTSARLKKGEVLYLETHMCRYELCFVGEKVVKGATASQVHETEPDKSQSHNLLPVNGERVMVDIDGTMMNRFRWSHCRKLFPQKLMRSVGIPLPLEHLEVLEETLDWEDIQWSQTGVWIAGKEYPLARAHFILPN